MSFYKKLRNGEDTDFSTESALEEQYQKMYKKIARDFIHRDDFVEILRELLNNFDLDSEGKARSIKHAVLRSYEYENNLENSLANRKEYPDVTEMHRLTALKKEDS